MLTNRSISLPTFNTADLFIFKMPFLPLLPGQDKHDNNNIKESVPGKYYGPIFGKNTTQTTSTNCETSICNVMTTNVCVKVC